MAALGISAKLRLVERDEAELAIERHRFSGAQEPARILRQDLLLAGNQRDRLGPLDPHHPVIDLARKQAQREADHARRMTAQPLDREVGLAGVGRTQNRYRRRRTRSTHLSCEHWHVGIAAQAPQCEIRRLRVTS